MMPKKQKQYPMEIHLATLQVLKPFDLHESSQIFEVKDGERGEEQIVDHEAVIMKHHSRDEQYLVIKLM